MGTARTTLRSKQPFECLCCGYSHAHFDGCLVIKVMVRGAAVLCCGCSPAHFDGSLVIKVMFLNKLNTPSTLLLHCPTRKQSCCLSLAALRFHAAIASTLFGKNKWLSCVARCCQRSYNSRHASSSHVRNRHLGLGYSPPTTRYIMAPSFDVDRRRQKRIFSLLVVQSTPSFRFYIQAYDFGAVPELTPPDPYDLANISVRRWKWLLRHYDKALKTFASEQNAW